MEKDKKRKLMAVIIIIALILIIAGGLLWYYIFGPEQEIVVEVPEPILVDDFDEGATKGVFYERINSLGGYQGTWSKRPSYSLITKTTDPRRGESGQALKISFKKEAGWCGWYTLLEGIDASGHNVLTFWIKGEKGHEKFDIGIADMRMQELEIDAEYFGTINSFLDDGITTEWQKVRVPLSRIASTIDLDSLGSLVIWFKYGGEGVIYLEDIMFEYDPKIAEYEKMNRPQVKKDKRYPRSMWVWKLDPVVNKEGREELMDFCKQANIGILYLYFEKISPDYMDFNELGEFLKEAHKNHIEVESLIGNPTWALEEKHHLAIDWTKSFLDYNAQADDGARFDGASFDVEPYLALEWQVNRQKIKEEYIGLLAKIRAMIDKHNAEYKDDFVVGAAIPVFYTNEDGESLKPGYLNTWTTAP